MPRQIKTPALTLHKPTGQARCRIDGRDHYLGPYGSQEAQQRYDDLKAEWLARQDVSRVTLVIDDLAIRYMRERAATYYRHKGGAPTSEVAGMRHALKFLVAVEGRTRVREFGPLKLEGVRQKMIDAGLARTTINQHVHRIRRVFRWAVAKQIVPESCWTSLKAVVALEAGRSDAREPERVKPVPEAVIEATLPHLSPVVADMVRLQLLCGCRPGELCAMRPRDVTRGVDGVWTYRPAHHKLSHRDIERRIFIGPKAQDILAKYLLRDADAYCFSPAESEAKRVRRPRKSPVTPSEAARKRKGRKLRDRFTKDTYNRAVRYACEAAFGMPAEFRDVGRTVRTIKDPAERQAARKRLSAAASDWRAEYCWSPNQLRHNAATMLRSQFDVEAAQVVLGHSDPRMTTRYAEQNFAKAADVARRIG